MMKHCSATRKVSHTEEVLFFTLQVHNVYAYLFCLEDIYVYFDIFILSVYAVSAFNTFLIIRPIIS